MKRFLCLALFISIQSQAAYVCENGKSKLSFKANAYSATGELITNSGTRIETSVTFSGYSHPSSQTTRVPSAFKPEVFHLVDSWGTAAKLSVQHTRVTNATYESEGQVTVFNNCQYKAETPPVIIFNPGPNRNPHCPRCGDADLL